MNILDTLSEKPWLDKSPGAKHETPTDSLHAKKFALGIFLTIVSVLFSLLIVTFLARSQYPDFKALAGDVWQPFYNPTRLWVNTVILIASGLLMQFSLSALMHEKTKVALIGLVASLFFGLQFLSAQLMLWQHLQGLGYYVASNPANSYFYLFTAIHGLHLFGGLLVLARAVLRFRRQSDGDKLCQSVQLCTRYWHYMLVVWLILFALMCGSPETYKTLAALCGY